MSTIYFAGGCFWGVEEYFARLNGVLETKVGYANSKIVSPSYEEVCTGNTSAAETVKITYDENIISLEELLTNLFKIIDPYALNKQGNDMGTQYRSGIYYENQKDLDIIKNFINNIQEKSTKKVLTEVKILENFYEAEEYHQRYLKNNPGGYCHIKLD